jgi:hypothetical protein
MLVGAKLRYLPKSKSMTLSRVSQQGLAQGAHKILDKQPVVGTRSVRAASVRTDRSAEAALFRIG